MLVCGDEEADNDRRSLSLLLTNHLGENMTIKTNQPIHQHDCTECDFLYGFLTSVDFSADHDGSISTFVVTDVYFCNGEAAAEGGTVILRSGTEGEYVSRPMKVLSNSRFLISGGMAPCWEEAYKAVKARQASLDAIEKDKKIREAREAKARRSVLSPNWRV